MQLCHLSLKGPATQSLQVCPVHIRSCGSVSSVQAARSIASSEVLGNRLGAGRSYSQRTRGRSTLNRYISSSPWQVWEGGARSGKQPNQLQVCSTHPRILDPRVLGLSLEEGEEDGLVVGSIFKGVPAHGAMTNPHQ